MNRNILTGNGLDWRSGFGGAKMRFLRTMAIAAACAAGMVAAHGQIGGDEPGGHAQTARPPAPITKPRTFRISSGVMQGLLLKKVDPVYPGDARVEGTVVLHAIIGKDGHVQSLEAVSGPAMLKGAAIDAVRQWTYKPYLLNGEPVEVDTTVVIEFHRLPR
jgi:protein TonB